MEETISLQEIFGILRKRLGLIFLCTILGVLVAGATTFFLITPKYSSSAQLIVKSEQNAAGTTNAGDINANILMINTYKDIIKGNAVLDEVKNQVAEQDGYQLSVGQLSEMIEVTQTQNSQSFTIKVTSDNPQEAELIANKTATIFQAKAGEILSVDKVSIISPATINENQVSPNNKLNLAIGFAVGLMLGVGLAFILEFADKTVKDERFIAEVLELPILGAVAEMTSKELADAAKVDLRPEVQAIDSEGTPPSEIIGRRQRSRV